MTHTLFACNLTIGPQFLRHKWTASIIGVLIIILTPYIHLVVAYRGWNDEKPKVNQSECSCNCWDTYFKGSYEKGIPTYKHVYFNLTPQTFKIWIITIIFFIASYETLKRLISLMVGGKLRYSMFALFGSVVYSHYYGWWAYFNYYNDDYYQQFYHQTIFTVTEVVSTILVLQYCNNENPIRPRGLLVVITIAVSHILVSGADQFVKNVFYGKGEWFRTWRDIGLMSPDVLHVVVCFVLLKRYVAENGIHFWKLYTRVDITLALGSCLSLLTLCKTFTN